MRVLVFGDSITQGFWDTEGGWVGRLRKYYDSRQIADLEGRDEPTIFNLGISGGKSDTILARMSGKIEARRYPNQDIALIFGTGMNDSYKKDGQYYSTPEDFEKHIEEIITCAKQYSSKIMFIGLTCPEDDKTTPVSWDNVVYTEARAKIFNSIIEKVTERHSVSLVQVFEKFKTENKNQTLLADGLHPNNKGHEFMFELIKPELEKLLV